MARYLLVANQTIGGAELDRAISERIAAGDAAFHVVVPLTEPEQETTVWVPADPAFGVPVATASEPATEEAMEEARKRSEVRLERLIDRIVDAGGSAEGEIGSSDPYLAAKDVLERERFDEVIVSTLPAGLSRWLRMDLPSRIERLADVPVTTVEAQPRGD